jgi:ketosteroid isomerase-like protein
VTTIEERLRRLEDAEEIRRLIQEYRRQLDAHDLVAYGLLFAENGEWIGGTGYGKSPQGITAMLTEGLPPRSPGPQSSWHLLTDPVITVDGDRATGLLTWSWVGRGDGDAPVMRLLGTYEDTYVRENGRWRFRTRIAHTNIPHKEPQLPDGWGQDPEPAAAPEARADAGAAPADVATRLRRLEDLEQIRRLFTEYKVALDQQDFAAYADLFAEDGEFAAGPGVAKGRAAIRAMVGAMPGSLLGAAPGADYHVMVNPLIELDPADPDRARAELTWLYVVKGNDGGPELAKLGHYDDTLVREGGRWRFLRREAPADIE